MSPDDSHFATASDDGSVKLWDLQKLDGRSLINRSRQTHSRPGIVCPYKMKLYVLICWEVSTSNYLTTQNVQIQRYALDNVYEQARLL